MKFKNLKYKGENSNFNGNCLKHLQPEIIKLNGKTVLIQFSIHTWTKERFVDGNTMDVDFVYKNNLDKRIFNEKRYKLSIGLKNILKSLTPNHRLMRDFKNND